MDEVINVGMNKINKTPEAVKATSMQVKAWHGLYSLYVR